MLHKSFAISIVSAFILFFCSCNNSSASKPGTSDSNTSTSSVHTNTPDAKITGNGGMVSYTIDGQHVQAVNNVQPSNLFINEVSNDAANGMLKIEVTTNTSNVLHFQLANSGTTSIDNYSPSLGNFGNKKSKEATYMDGKTGQNFYGGPVTITITGISAARVAGKFSGKFTEDKNDGGASVDITDGSFDLPFGKN